MAPSRSPCGPCGRRIQQRLRLLDGERVATHTPGRHALHAGDPAGQFGRARAGLTSDNSRILPPGG